MIRAHMATFPPRRKIMMDVVQRIAPQVDEMFICLNEYSEIPGELADFGNVTAMIPDRDMKDVGKFAFDAAPDDVVFTVDDDILYPPDYVKTVMEQAKQVELEVNTIGYQGNAWVFKKQQDKFAWRNFLFFNACPKILGATVLGSGTACMLGRNMPSVADLAGSEGFVDLRFSRLLAERGVKLWVLPRSSEYLLRNLPDELQETTLFNTVAKKGREDVRKELRGVLAAMMDNAGKPFSS